MPGPRTGVVERSARSPGGDAPGLLPPSAPPRVEEALISAAASPALSAGTPALAAFCTPTNTAPSGCLSFDHDARAACRPGRPYPGSRRGEEDSRPPGLPVADVEDDLLSLDLAILYQVKPGTWRWSACTERASRYLEVEHKQRIALIARTS